jgi:hypothetical protein
VSPQLAKLARIVDERLDALERRIAALEESDKARWRAALTAK